MQAKTVNLEPVMGDESLSFSTFLANCSTQHRKISQKSPIHSSSEVLSLSLHTKTFISLIHLPVYLLAVTTIINIHYHMYNYIRPATSRLLLDEVRSGTGLGRSLERDLTPIRNLDRFHRLVIRRMAGTRRCHGYNYAAVMNTAS